MKIILSPAKRLNERPLDRKIELPEATPILFPKETQVLLEILKKLGSDDLQKLMKISPKVAELNLKRYRELQIPFEENNGKPAIFLFDGDAYKGLDASSLSKDDLSFAQEHLRILSGLYGVLRPLDIIMPYRLEMGSKLKGRGFNNLYEFWKARVTDYFRMILKNDPSPCIINVASKEYFSVIDTDSLNTPVYTMHFKEYRDGQYKFLTYYGKKARGLLARFIIKNKLNHPEEIKLFDLDGYHFHPGLSSEFDWVFTRGD